MYLSQLPAEHGTGWIRSLDSHTAPLLMPGGHPVPKKALLQLAQSTAHAAQGPT